MKSRNTSDFQTELRKLLGKSFNDSEINELMQIDEQSIKEKIKLKFLEKRNQRNDIIGEKQAKEIEKRIL